MFIYLSYNQFSFKNVFQQIPKGKKLKTKSINYEPVKLYCTMTLSIWEK